MGEREEPGWARVLRRWAWGILLLVLVATLAGYGGRASAVADLFAHMRVQLLWGAVLVAGALVLVRCWRTAAVAGVVLLLNAAAVLPWSFGGEGTVPRGPRIRLLYANVERSNSDHQAIVDLARARSADLVALVEVDTPWLHDIEALGRSLPHAQLEPRDDRFGVALYSRWPIIARRVVRTGAANRPTLVATVEAGHGPPLTVIVTHPPPPVSADLFDERNRQLSRLTELVGEHGQGPLVLAGDLNVTPFSPWYDGLGEREGLRNARRGFGVLPTWPASLPSPMRIPIDHVLVSGLRVVDTQVAAAIGSDHRPLYVVLTRP